MNSDLSDNHLNVKVKHIVKKEPKSSETEFSCNSKDEDAYAEIVKTEIKEEDCNESQVTNENASIADIKMEQTLHIGEGCFEDSHLTSINTCADSAVEQSLHSTRTDMNIEENKSLKGRKRPLSPTEDADINMKEATLFTLDVDENDDASVELELPLEDNESTVKWLKRRGLLTRELVCPACRNNMSWMKCSKNTDGFTWRCQEKTCPKFKSRLSIRTGSHFSKSHISLQKWVQTMYLWCRRTPLPDTVVRLGIPEAKTVSCYGFFRAVCVNHFRSNPVKMGGPGVVLEIGEYCFTIKLRNSRERIPSTPLWVFAIVNTTATPMTGLVEVVQANEPVNVWPIIQATVLPGTIIPSKCWKEYRQLQGFDCTQVADIHSVNFIDPDSVDYLARIEHYWANLKTFVSWIHECRQENMTSYLQEYMWHERHPDNAFEKICDHIAIQNKSPPKREKSFARLDLCTLPKYVKKRSIKPAKSCKKIEETKQDDVNSNKNEEKLTDKSEEGLSSEVDDVNSNKNEERLTDKSEEGLSSEITTHPWLLEDSIKVISWLKSRQLIKPEMKCIGCLKQMRWTKCRRTMDGFAWRCQTASCPRYKSTFSIRTGSFFSKSHMSLPKWVKAMYMWTARIGATRAGLLLDISVKTMMSFYSFFRDVCSLHFRSAPIMLGGPGIVIEIDACCFSNVPKYHPHRSSKQPPIWVFGIVDTSTSVPNGYMRIVESQDPDSVFPIIQSVTLPGSIIPSEYWKEYRAIQGIDCSEIANIHSLNFVDPQSIDHIPKIESYWERHKGQIKTMHGCKGHLMESYIQEFMWHERYSDNGFEHLCSHILHLYPD